MDKLIVEAVGEVTLQHLMRGRMMKKTLFVSILIILQLFCINSFAGDTDTYFAVNDNTKLFTATVVLVKSEIIELQVIKKIKGDISENEILQMPYFEYNARKDRNPKLGDSCFVAFVKDGTFYSVKTTSTEPKTLKFINHLTNLSMNMQGQSIDERIEKNINDGTYEKAEKKRQEELSKRNMDKNSESVIKPEISSSKIKLGLILSILGGLILIFGGTIFLKNRKMKHQDLEVSEMNEKKIVEFRVNENKKKAEEKSKKK